MPTIFAISGAEEEGEGKCRRVKSGKKGCTQLLCPESKLTKNGKHRWRFRKGSMRCPAKAR